MALKSGGLKRIGAEMFGKPVALLMHLLQSRQQLFRKLASRLRGRIYWGYDGIGPRASSHRTI